MKCILFVRRERHRKYVGSGQGFLCVCVVETKTPYVGTGVRGEWARIEWHPQGLSVDNLAIRTNVLCRRLDQRFKMWFPLLQGPKWKVCSRSLGKQGWLGSGRGLLQYNRTSVPRCYGKSTLRYVRRLVLPWHAISAFKVP